MQGGSSAIATATPRSTIQNTRTPQDHDRAMGFRHPPGAQRVEHPAGDRSADRAIPRNRSRTHSPRRVKTQRTGRLTPEPDPLSEHNQAASPLGHAGGLRGVQRSQIGSTTARGRPPARTGPPSSAGLEVGISIDVCAHFSHNGGLYEHSWVSLSADAGGDGGWFSLWTGIVGRRLRTRVRVWCIRRCGLWR